MSEANKTVELIADGKKLVTLIPKGQSPKLYLDLIKAQVMGVDKQGNQRPDEDLLLFLYVAKRTGLDPLNKQIYAIYRWNTKVGRDTMTIQAAIDGMRVVAQRTKGYAGQDDVVFDDETKKYPNKATVTVYKLMDGQKVSFTASARWNEYVQTDPKGMPLTMWAKMPFLMLGKCAEALALRKAFPNELSGIYTAEEMQQSTNPLAGIEAPKQFAKKEIEVVHGAPADLVVTPEPNTTTEEKGKNETDQTMTTGNNSTAEANTEENKTDDKTPKVILGTKKEPDLGAMRKALKPKSVEELQKRALEIGKEIGEKEKTTK